MTPFAVWLKRTPCEIEIFCDPPVKLTALQPGDCAFWETDEKHPEYFNDGANWPEEGVSGRHQNGGIQAEFGGAVNYVRLNAW